MSGGLVEDLQQQIARGQAIVVAGAGVAIAATGGDPRASWPGLLRATLAWCQEHVPGAPAQWPEVVRLLLEAGDVESLLTAAELLTTWMGGRGGGEYRRWLHDQVGALRLWDPALPEALIGLGVPVATTNYDGLIELAGGWGWVTWQDSPRMQRVLHQDPRTAPVQERAVVHLHGHWEVPGSVVLGIRSYEAALGDRGTQALQQAIGTMRSLVLVGVGEGAGDPNLGALRRWLAATFPSAEHRHFRLCLESEVQALAQESERGGRMVPLAYGSRHEELTGFLRGLARPAPASAVGSPAAALPAPRLTLGRAAQVAQAVANLLRAQPAATLVLGPPGIGKTNLALAVLHEPGIAARYGGRRYFVDCDGATSASAVETQLARMLGVPLVAGEVRAACLARLSGSPAVVCLDNAETPWENDRPGCDQLFVELAGAATLLVSLRGNERPHGPSWAPSLCLEPLDPDDARTLFLLEAELRFDQPGVTELLADMGGVPLAVELLGRAARGEASLDHLARRWHQEGVRLLDAEGNYRLKGVAVTLDASWNAPLMTEPARRLLSLLSWLPDGVAHGDLDALQPGDGQAAANVLRRRGLALDTAGRLRTFPPFRRYVEDSHPPDPTVGQQTASYYRELVGELGSRQVGAEAVSRLRAEMSNLTRALLAGLRGDDPLPSLDALQGAAQFALLTGSDLTGVFHVGVEVARAFHDDPRLTRTLERLGDIALARSDHEAARSAYNEALEVYRLMGDAPGEDRCRKRLGDIAL